MGHKANARCAAFTERWAKKAAAGPVAVIRGPMLTDMASLILDVQALPGAGPRELKAVEGWAAAINEVVAGEVPQDLEWLAQLKDVGALTCWQIFQAPT